MSVDLYKLFPRQLFVLIELLRALGFEIFLVFE